jgi:hypothetical protein
MTSFHYRAADASCPLKAVPSCADAPDASWPWEAELKIASNISRSMKRKLRDRRVAVRWALVNTNSLKSFVPFLPPGLDFVTEPTLPKLPADDPNFSNMLSCILDRLSAIEQAVVKRSKPLDHRLNPLAEVFAPSPGVLFCECDDNVVEDVVEINVFGNDVPCKARDPWYSNAADTADSEVYNCDLRCLPSLAWSCIHDKFETLQRSTIEVVCDDAVLVGVTFEPSDKFVPSVGVPAGACKVAVLGVPFPDGDEKNEGRHDLNVDPSEDAPAAALRPTDECFQTDAVAEPGHCKADIVDEAFEYSEKEALEHEVRDEAIALPAECAYLEDLDIRNAERASVEPSHAGESNPWMLLDFVEFAALRCSCSFNRQLIDEWTPFGVMLEENIEGFEEPSDD